jgi:hypothetical protein
MVKGGRRGLALFCCPHTNLSGMIRWTLGIAHDPSEQAGRKPLLSESRTSSGQRSPLS